ncbi:MAG: response regulator [Gammaproteobacteria bacterium]
MAHPQILVVEDQRAVAGALRMRLRGLGYEVLGIAKDGAEAVEKAGALKPDLILMDIRLGEGMDGIEAAHKIQARYDIPVVYVTAYADHELLDRARSTRPAGFINKPFTTKDLLTTLDLALAQRREAAAAPRAEAVLTTDGEGRVSFVSASAERITGISRESTVGQPLGAVLAELYGLPRAAAEQLVNEVLATGEERAIEVPGGGTLIPLADARGTALGIALRLDEPPPELEDDALKRMADSYRFVLDHVPLSVLLLEADLKVAHASAQARRIIDANPRVSIEKGYFKAATSGATDELRGRVRRCLNETEAGEDATGELFDFGADADDDGLLGVITRIPSTSEVAGTAAVALMLFDRAHRQELSDSVLREVYGLTRSEVRLVQNLVGGCSLERAANDLGISVNTARTHLKHVFHKTGARRQSELIHQLETGPASLAIRVAGAGRGSRSRPRK